MLADFGGIDVVGRRPERAAPSSGIIPRHSGRGDAHSNDKHHSVCVVDLQKEKKANGNDALEMLLVRVPLDVRDLFGHGSTLVHVGHRFLQVEKLVL